MSTNLFIAGDWGTSNLRLYLCQFRDSGLSLVIDTRSGPGVSQVEGDFESTFFQLVGDWIAERGAMPVLLSGMVGSTIGWHEAPYLQCPVNVGQIAEGRLAFEARGLQFSIVSGLKVINPLGSADVMRGEELQLLGWMQSNKQASDSARLFALPGTHNKWGLLKGGKIETFITALTGELFALLQKHSILIADRDSKDFNPDSFLAGVQAIEQLGEAQLLHALFATRSRQVLGELSAKDASSYLSGLLVGADVIGATNLFKSYEPGTDSVTLIGDSRLSEYYRLVLERQGIAVETSDTTQIAIAGYEAIYNYLYTKG